MFRRLKQKADESFKQFLARLKAAAKACVFYENRDQEISMQIMNGATMSEKLIAEKVREPLSLAQLVQLANRFEANEGMKLSHADAQIKARDRRSARRKLGKPQTIREKFLQHQRRIVIPRKLCKKLRY